MYEISIRETTRRVRRLWLRLRCRFNGNQMTQVEVDEMSRATQLVWRDYWNGLAGQPLRFVGIQGIIILSTGALYALAMSVSIRNIEDYIGVAFEYLSYMAQGVDIYANGLNIQISGDEMVDPEDVRSGRIDFKIGFDQLRPAGQMPVREVNQNFTFEDQQNQIGSEPPSDNDQQLFSDNESVMGREEEYNRNVQLGRREELERRINLLLDEIENLSYQINQNFDMIRSLRASPNRRSVAVQQLQADMENQNFELRGNRNRLERQLRGLRNLFESPDDLQSNYDPDTDQYSISDYSDIQNSPFSVPDNYQDTSEDEEEVELERERAARIEELSEEIARGQYQISEFDNLITDLRSRRINRRTEEYRNLLRETQDQRTQVRGLVQTWQRQLRNLQRNRP